MADAVEDGAPHDVQSLLSSPDRDFLIRNNGDEVKVDSLKGKKIGLYFSASWCSPCHLFTPALVEVYNELSPRGDLEIIFISADEDEESFSGYFSKMPWLAIPFSNSEKRDSLDELFKVRGIPHLVILDGTGTVITDRGVDIILEYGVEGHPFTSERIKELEGQEEAARRNQSLTSLLVHGSRDFVVSSNGNKVPITELEGKLVGLYFSLSTYKSCVDFTPKLLEVYEKLKAEGESFEIVQIPLDDDEASFNQSFGSMPWLSLPLEDKKCEKLVVYFELSKLPSLVIIGQDGKTLHSNVAETVEEHGAAAYPFTPEKFAELAEIEKKREESQTLESILVSGDLDFVTGKDGTKIPVSDLVGKTVLLYFSAHWCPPCRAFLPVLTDAYEKIKAAGNALEVIFISSDLDQTAFGNYFAKMPWLALPFGDERKKFLSRKFKVEGIPMLVAIGPTGRTVSNKATDLIMEHGADAYPFTAEHLKKFEEKFKESIKGWPEKLKHPLHEEHVLVPAQRRNYICDGCDEVGEGWSYYCEECDFDLHPKCAVGEDKATETESDEDEHLKKFEEKSTENIKAWTELLKHPLNEEHNLVPTQRRNSICYDCDEVGEGRSYYSEECDFDLHPKCADGEDKTIDIESDEDKHLKKFAEKFKESIKSWQEKSKHSLHEENELVPVQRRNHICDGCDEVEEGWSNYCEKCDFDLHPKCAVGEETATQSESNENDEAAREEAEEGGDAKEGWVCGGEVCYKA